MPYKLRPESKLKRPFWYQKEDDDSDDDREGTSTSLGSNAGPWKHHTQDSSDHISSVAAHFRPGESSLTSPHRLSHQPSPTQQALQVNPGNGARRSQNMAKVKYVRRRRDAETLKRSLEDIANAARTRLHNTQQPIELTALSVDPSAQPAAFPSLPTIAPTAEPVDKPDNHGLPRRMDAYKACNQVGIERSERAVDAMYACKRFPENLDAKQKEWYRDLQKCWLPGEDLVHNIEFESLYPSLRATIITQIYEAFPFGTYHDGFFPVRHLLQISDPTFQRIIEENAHVWESHEIPLHLVRLKRENHDKVIDEDTPPQTGVVHAIRFLQQMHLPGSLLGEWQFPLPKLEAFIIPFGMVVDDDSRPSTVCASSPITDATDLDDECEVSLTENYLERVVHTRPHAQKLPRSREPDLLLPPALKHVSRHLDSKRKAALPASVHEALVPGSDPDVLLAGPSTQQHNIPSAHYHPKTSTSSQTPKNWLAAHHASLLWAEHRFNNLDLTTQPTYLDQQPRTTHEAAIQLELMILWKRDLSKHMARMEDKHQIVAFSKEFRGMEKLMEKLRRGIVGLQQALIEKGEKPISYQRPGENSNEGTKTQQNPQHKYVSLQQRFQQTRLLPTGMQGAATNYGFGASTKVIPYQAESSKTLGKENSIEIIDLEAQQSVVSQMKKKTVEVVDLEAQKSPVPQVKKRTAEVIDLDEDVAPQTKKRSAVMIDLDNVE